MSQWDQVSEQFARLSLAADEAPIGMERVRAHEMKWASAAPGSVQPVVRRGVRRPHRPHPSPVLRARRPTHPRPLHVAATGPGPRPRAGGGRPPRGAVASKWAIDLIETLPEVPLSALVAAIDDVEEVYRAEGAALRPVYAARARLAQRLGDRDAVARELSAWLAEPRDRHSDCLACEHRGQSRLVAPDDPARALDLLAPVIDGDLTCGEEPRTSSADAALLRLHLGDVEGAVSAFRRSWHRPGRPHRRPERRHLPAGAAARGQHRPRDRPPAPAPRLARRPPVGPDVVLRHRCTRARPRGRRGSGP